MGSTLNRLSEGRFALGLAKGVGLRWQALNVDFPSFAHEGSFVELMRRLWQGEQVLGHDSPLGHYPALQLAPYVHEDIPLLYVGFGPKSLEHAGRIYNGAHLHTFMSDQALSDAVAAFRRGEAAAGRAGGKLWSVFATVHQPSETDYLKMIVARLATYLQIPGYGEALVTVNGWDMDTLSRFRSAATVKNVGGAIDSVADFTQLQAIEKLIPEHWRPAAVGDAKTCAERWVDQFNAGADGLIIHASTPEQFEPVLAEYAKIRPDALFDGRSNRPG
jgi:probable F420-dependent oxidoreductase